jgi:hypothetical protein
VLVQATKTAGVVPDVAPIVSHVVLPLAEALHCSVPEPVLDMAMFVGSGLSPPCTPENVSAPGKTNNCGATGVGRLVSLKSAATLNPAIAAEMVLRCA